MATSVYLIGAAAVDAAVVVQFNQPKPVANVIAFYDPTGGSPGGNGWLYTSATNRPVAETFAVPGAAVDRFELERITMKLNAAPADFSQLSSFKITIYEIAGVASNPISSTILSTQFGTMQPTAATAPAGYFSFNLDTHVTLEGGKVYSYVLEFQNSSTSQTLSLQYNGLGGNGKAWQNTNGGGWIVTGGGAGLTYVYYLEGTVVPEAGTVSLLGLGALAPLLHRLKKRRA